MVEEFLSWNPHSSSREVLDHVDHILGEYQEMGYRLTLRQLYYQLVARDIIENSTAEYHRVGNIVSRGRLAGIIDWVMIEDRGRRPVMNTHWNSPQEILETAKNAYYLSKWEDQINYVEVWCEKDAVSNILEPVCQRYDVLFMANRGYSSQTAMYDGFHRFQDALDLRKDVRLFYFGDHDPSGIDMVEDIQKRLGLFRYRDSERIFDRVTRVALNMDQIERYNPPENPAKTTDTRYQRYVELYGESSWELDALDPAVLSSLVEGSILEICDMDIFRAVESVEAEHKEFMQTAIDSL